MFLIATPNFSYSGRHTFAHKEDRVHEQDWLSNGFQNTIINPPPTGRGKVKMALQIQIESAPNLLVRALSAQICRQDWL